MTKLILSAIVAFGIIASLATYIFKRIWSKEAEDRKMVEQTDLKDPSSITSTFDRLNRCLIVGALLLFSGCARVVLHPIKKIDIMPVKKGLTYEAPKDGYFLSEEYIKLVMQAKIK